MCTMYICGIERYRGCTTIIICSVLLLSGFDVYDECV